MTVVPPTTPVELVLEIPVRVRTELELHFAVGPLPTPVESEEDMPATADYPLVVSDQLLAKDPDPHWVTVTPAAATAWRILHLVEIDLSTFATLARLDLVLLWRTQGGAGESGSTKWALSRQSETIGVAPLETVDLSAEFSAGETLAEHGASGTAPSTALGVGPFTLMLLGKVDSPGDNVAAEVSDESSAVVTSYV